MKNPSVQLISGSKWEKTLSAWSQNIWYCKTNTITTTSTTKSRTICGLRSKRMRILGLICYILTVSVCFWGVAFCTHLQRTEETNSRLKALTSCTHATRRVTCSHSAKTHISRVNSDFDLVTSVITLHLDTLGPPAPLCHQPASPGSSVSPEPLTCVIVSHSSPWRSLQSPPQPPSPASPRTLNIFHLITLYVRDDGSSGAKGLPLFLQEATTFVFNRDILMLRKSSSIVKWWRNLDNLDRIQR